MTTTTVTEPGAQLGVTQLRTATSEWIKFRSLRSTWWSIGVALLISVGLGILFADLRGSDIQRNGGFELDRTALSLRGFYLAQLAVGALGVLFITGEYSTGMIRATLGAVPRRLPVWTAKIAVFASVTFLITLAAAFAAFLGGQAVLSKYQFHGVINGAERQRHDLHWSQHGRPQPRGAAEQPRISAGDLRRRAVHGRRRAARAGLRIHHPQHRRRYRDPVRAASRPAPAGASPADLAVATRDEYLPLLAGTAGMNTVGGTDQLSPWAGLGVFAIYVVAALGVGLYVLRRRDA